MSDTQMVLPIDTVMYQAQEVAAVLATSRYVAADGVAAVEVDYEPLPVVVDPHQGARAGRTSGARRQEGQTQPHLALGGGRHRRRPTRSSPRPTVTVKQDIYIPRIHVASIETCGCVADFDKVERQADHLHDHAGAARHPHRASRWSPGTRPAEQQDPRHLARHRRRLRRQGAGLSRLRRSPSRPRCSPASRSSGSRTAARTCRPTPSPATTTSPPSWRPTKDGTHHRRCASRRWPTTATPTRRPTRPSSRPGCSASAPARTTSRPRTSKSTASTPTSRRAALPTAARSASPKPCTRSSAWSTSWRTSSAMDPAEFRLKNFIKPEQFPYKSRAGLGVRQRQLSRRALQLAMEMIGYDDLRKEQAEKRARGELMGIGISSFTEIVGAGPSQHFDILGLKMFDSAARSASTRPARRSRASAPSRRARGTRPPTPRSSPRSWASRPRTSRSRKATPTPRPTAWAPTPAAPRRPPARRRRWPRARSATRRERSPRTCWRSARKTWSGSTDKFYGQGLARPGQDHSGDRLRRLHQPPAGHGGRAGSGQLLRPAEPDLPVRHLHLRGGHRPGHRARSRSGASWRSTTAATSSTR